MHTAWRSMCLHFNILYGWIFNDSRSPKKDKTKAKQSSRSQQHHQQQQQNTTQGLTTHYERNLIDSFEANIANVADFNQTNKEQKQIKENEMSVEEVSISSNNNNSNNNNGNQQDFSSIISSGESARLSGDSKMMEAAITTTISNISAEFKIRTSNRRHVDFDKEFDLSDVNAPNRSRWSGPFHFIQAADSQFGMIDSYIHKRTEPGWSEEIQLCENLVATCNQMDPKPKFMIICGDLADAWPSTETRRKQVVDFKRIFAKLDNKIPLVCVCGNHDVGDEPTMDSVQEYRRNFGDDYFYFTLNDVLFIVINSQFYQNREFVQDYARKQDEWLESMLAKCKLFKYSIVFEHIPWFLEHFDEEDDYFNIKKEVRLQWLRKFKEAGVTKIMCGHYHRNAGGWYENMELVVTSAIGAQCGNDKSGVRIVKVLEESIEHQYYAMQEIPQKIQFS